MNQSAATRQIEQYWVLGDLYTFHLATPELAIIEVVSSENHGPPLHSHTNEDESFFVLSGRLKVARDGQELEVTAGDFVHFARGTAHTFRTISPEGSRILVTLSPGRFVDLFRKIGVLDAASAQDGAVLEEAKTKLLASAGSFGLHLFPRLFRRGVRE